MALLEVLKQGTHTGTQTYMLTHTHSHNYSSSQDIAKYINATKGDFEAIKSVKEVEASLSSYTGPSLLQFGRYCLDGELKVKLADQAQPKSK